MNFLKFCLAIVISALSTGAILSTASYFLSLNHSSVGSGNFISFSNPENLVAIIGAILGVIIGGISSVIIVGFQLNILKAILFGFVFNFLLSAALLIITQESWANKYMRYTFYALIINGIIISAIISLIKIDGKITEL